MNILAFFIFCVQVAIITCLTLTQRWCLFQRNFLRNRSLANPNVNPYTARVTAETYRSPRVMPEPDVSRLFRWKRFALGSIPTRAPAPPTSSDERERSLCSWDWVLDINSTRWPRNMYKAVCAYNSGHNQCNFNFSNVNNFDTSALDHLRLETECALVKAPVRIQNECCINGEPVTRTAWIDWPVACVCARKRIYNVS